MATQEELLAAQQYVLAEFNKAKERLKPAVLADIKSNGLMMSAYMTKNNLPPTAENFYNTIKALFATLEWTVKPAKLLVQEKDSRPDKVVPQVEYEIKREKDARATEAATEQKKASASAYVTARAAVDAYKPLKPGPYGRVDYVEQAATVKLLTDYINKNESNNVSGTGTLEQVAKYLRERYEVIEKRGQQV